MSIFKICILEKNWLKECENVETDLCLHGRVNVIIGDEVVAENYDCTISSTAIYLLKSLTNNHYMDEMSNQMLPCCGHFIIPMEDDTVEISGCQVGVDWSVIHKGNSVSIKTRRGTEININIDEYRESVIKFVDEVEQFYINSGKKVLPEDDFYKKGYSQFWNEWRERRYGISEKL
ncbi:hypothetical protein [Anaeromicrobium sediminis]|uniref:Uncharacterized protein n=1 Tax=Anaeromicrobium sediminis TaxID=1478221 RepID=A0A267MLC2_9FIRM|nr:hypothetical protein [Anaeromicrobium sediminis]PAB60336.1 hypothetical protein CCE28_05425 [Anaeromicrobium sediminis]